MSDLRKHHTGSIGPITFDKINEAVRRLDSLLPFVESVSVDQTEKAVKNTSSFLVYAKRGEDQVGDDPTDVTTYTWSEIIVRDNGFPANFEDPDWDTLSEGVKLRSGEANDDQTAAISLYPFVEGYAVAFPTRDLSNILRFVLFPLSVGGGGDPVENSSGMCMMKIISDEDPDDFVSVPYADSNHPRGSCDFDSVSVWRYSAREVSAVVKTCSGGGTQWVFEESQSVSSLYDFSVVRPNIPGVEGALLFELPLQDGTYTMAVKREISNEGSTFNLYYMGVLPRLGVQCS